MRYEKAPINHKSLEKAKHYVITSTDPNCSESYELKQPNDTRKWSLLARWIIPASWRHGNYIHIPISEADSLDKGAFLRVGLLFSEFRTNNAGRQFPYMTHRVSRMKTFEDHILLTLTEYDGFPYQKSWLEENNWDKSYDKKRNYPDAEEREFDDVPQVGASLWYPFYRYNFPPHSHDCGAKFLPPKPNDKGSLRAMLGWTKQSYSGHEPVPGSKLQANGKTYIVIDFRYNQFPKYPIVLLEESTPVKYERKDIGYYIV